MAFRTSLALLKESSSEVLNRFLQRQPPSETFQNWQNPQTGCWRPSQYSQRRQAQLATQAALSNRLYSLPSGPKVARMQARLENLGQHTEFESMASTIRYAPLLSQEMVESGTKGARRRSEQDREEALKTVKLEGWKGPYKGRQAKKMFKGQKVEREARERRETVRNKLEGMNELVKEWQATNAENKSKLKLGLPF